VHVDERGVSPNWRSSRTRRSRPHTNRAWPTPGHRGRRVRPLWRQSGRVAAGEPSSGRRTWSIRLDGADADAGHHRGIRDSRPAEPLELRFRRCRLARQRARRAGRRAGRHPPRVDDGLVSKPAVFPRTASRPIRSPGSLLGLRRRAPWPPAPKALRDRRLSQSMATSWFLSDMLTAIASFTPGATETTFASGTR